MMKNTIFITLLIFTHSLFSQKTCAAKEENLEDLNAITKCSITPVDSKKTDGSKTLNVKISTSRKRYLKIKKNGNSSKFAKIRKIKEKNRAMKLSSLSALMSSKEIKSAKRFDEIDRIPGFKKCPSANEKNRLECFNKEMIKHINKNFHYPASAIQNKIEAKIWVRFIIDKKGQVRNVKTISTNPTVDTSELEEVAKYVVNKLPVFQAGTKGGKAIAIKYGFPLEFSLED